MHTPDYTITPEFRDGNLMYVARVAGREVGAAYSYVGAEELAAPRYELMLDVSASDLDYDDLPTDAPGTDDPQDGPQPAPEDARDYSREYLAEVDHLCACADGEHILDWAMPDALAAHVGRGLRDCYHPMLGERVQAWPSGDVGVLLAVDELGYLIVDGSTRICLPRERVERIAYYTPAASPTPPAPSPLPSAAGGDAASAAGPCDVSGCRAPGSTVWLGRWPAYPARLCGAHRKAVA